ncbi:unnamed protein product [Enterobius vermicularis]|uniref:Secreted protein n=1 Tax=Enterobius vermicularis TaxID=51028 RepID=A0A0N4UZ08_ENTVE|nr:unnamed protein product [Enterobius vermicularis]
MISVRLVLLLAISCAGLFFPPGNSVNDAEDDDGTDVEFLAKSGFLEAKQGILNGIGQITQKLAQSNIEIMSHADDINEVYKQLPSGKNMKGWKRVSK